MKYAILTWIILFMFSCSQPETEQSIKDQITAYKKEVNTLNQKITELEKKLSSIDPSGESIAKVPVEIISPRPIRAE